MHVTIIYTHPSENSFTAKLRDSFISGLKDAGHTYEVSDLYKQNFQTDMSEEEYNREAFYNDKIPLPSDVIAEQEKLNKSDAIVFVYPVFWTEAPAKLVGWFDRVWTYGYAYEPCTMPHFKKALFIVCAGNTREKLEQGGMLQAMQTVMMTDRISTRAEQKEFHLFEGTSRGMETRDILGPKHLQKAYELGKNF